MFPCLQSFHTRCIFDVKSSALQQATWQCADGGFECCAPRRPLTMAALQAKQDAAAAASGFTLPRALKKAAKRAAAAGGPAFPASASASAAAGTGAGSGRGRGRGRGRGGSSSGSGRGAGSPPSSPEVRRI